MAKISLPSWNQWNFSWDKLFAWAEPAKTRLREFFPRSSRKYWLASNRRRPTVQLAGETLENRLVPTITATITSWHTTVWDYEGYAALHISFNASPPVSVETTVSVDYYMSDGSAINGIDYINVTGTYTVTLPVGSYGNGGLARLIPIKVDPDLVSNETFDAHISNPVNCGISGGVTTFTILDAYGVKNPNNPCGCNIGPTAGAVKLTQAIPSIGNEKDGFRREFGGPALEYRSDIAGAKQVIAPTLITPASRDLPDTVKARLNVAGTTQEWVTFSTDGLSDGDDLLLPLEVTASIPATDEYEYTVDFDLDFSASNPSFEPIAFENSDDYPLWQSNSGDVTPGWFIGGLEKLKSADSDNRITINAGTGSLSLWTKSGGTYSSTSHPHGSLVKNIDNTFDFSEGGFTHHFGTTGKLETIKTAGGQHTQTYTYSGDNLVGITNDFGASYTYSYTSGKLTSIQSAGSGPVTLTHDGNGNLSQIALPNGQTRIFTYDSQDRILTDQAGYLHTYTYDSETGGLSQTNFGSGAQSVSPAIYQGLDSEYASTEDSRRSVETDALGNLVTTVYDANYKPTSVQNADGTRATFTYDSLGNTLTSVDALNKTTTYSYATGTHDLTQIAYPDGTFVTYQYDSTWHKRTVEIDKLGNRTTTTYDGTTGEITLQIDPFGNRTTYTYSSGMLQSVTDPFGSRTTFLYDASHRLETTIDLLGNRTTFVYDGAGNRTVEIRPDGTRTTTTYDAANRQLTTVQPGVGTTTYTYSGDQLLSTASPLGLITSYVYDSQNRQVGIIENYGTGHSRRTTTVYDSYGRVETQIDQYGQRTTTVFDSLGRTSATVDSFGNRTTLLYDSYGRQETTIDQYGQRTTTIYDSQGRAEATVDPFGNRTTTVYDSYGRQWSTIDPFGSRTTTVFDSQSRVEATISPLNTRTTTVYDSYGRTVAQVDMLGNRSTVVFDSYGRTSAQIDALGNRSTFIYDTYGRPEATIDPHGYRSTAVYDSLGRVEATVNALGVRATTVYDSQGRVSASVDALGNRTSYLYDSYGHQYVTINALNQRTTLVFDTYDRQVATQDARGFFTTFVYDSYGRVEATINALGFRTTTVFDSQGRTSAQVNELGARTTFVYDSYGRVEATINVLGNRVTTVFDSMGRQSATVDPRGNRTTTQFDSYGREEATINALGARATTVYDTYGRVWAKVYIDGEGEGGGGGGGTYSGSGSGGGGGGYGTERRTTFVYDNYNRHAATINPLGNRTTTIFDSYGTPVATQNSLGHRTTSVFDALGRITEQVDHLNGRTTLVYDANGNRTVYVDPVGNRTTSTFDALGRETQRTDPLNHSATFAYDAVGHLISSTDRLGRRRDFSYDALGQRTGETWINADTSTANLLTFTYDGAGRQTTAGDYDGTYTLTYDALGQVTSVFSPLGLSLTFTYDSAGNRTQVQDSLGGTVTTTFDALNRLNDRTFSGSGQPTLRVQRSADGYGRVGSVSRYTNGSLMNATEYQYDLAGQITRIRHQDQYASPFVTYTYSYDSHGRLLSEDRNGTAVTYTYDNSDQLLADGTTTVTYDANGNRNNGSYATGTGNRLTTDGVWTYTYDDEGNLTKKSQGASASTWTYAYDHRNQLIWAKHSATDGGAIDKEVDFKYDVWGNRIEKDYDADGAGAGSAVVTKFAVDGWNPAKPTPIGTENFDVWADLDGNGSLTTRYLHDDAVDALFARIDQSGGTGTGYYHLTDRLGSIREVAAAASGTVLDAISYDGFGKIASETNSTYRGRYAWTGRELDAEIDLQYNRARYYDASTGRWISQDPLGFDAGDGNLYRYSLNRPSDSVDPSGMKVIIVGVEGYGGYNPFGSGGIFSSDELKQHYIDPFSGNDLIDTSYGGQIGYGGPLRNYLQALALADRLKTPSAWEWNGKYYTATDLHSIFTPGGFPLWCVARPVYDRIAITGWSWGGFGAIRLAEGLNSQGIRVDLLFTVDPVSKTLYLPNFPTIYASVTATVFKNYYQRFGFLKGANVTGASNIQLAKQDFDDFSVSTSTPHVSIPSHPTVKLDWLNQVHSLQKKPYRTKSEAFL